MTFWRWTTISASLITAWLVFFAVPERPTLMQPLAFAVKQLSVYVAILSGLLAGVASWLTGLALIRWNHLHAAWSADQVNGGPQKMHSLPTPRIGGLTLAVGLLVSLLVMHVAEKLFYPQFLLNTTYFQLVLLSTIPAFLAGTTEDLTKRVGPITRLLFTMASGGFAVVLIGSALTRLDIPLVDTLLLSIPLVAFLFTAFAVAGIASSINIIDGFHGLSAGYCIIILLALAGVGYLAGDNLVMQLSLALAGALIGFMCWNWPRGLIFLGDGGAYLLGFLIAEISILLVMRNPEVSAWFPLVLVIYPFMETLYSMYRRKLVHDRKATDPDRGHLHHLIHALIMAQMSHGTPASKRERANPKVAKFAWAGTLVVTISALYAWNSTPVLMALALFYAMIYIMLYRRFYRSLQQNAHPAIDHADKALETKSSSSF